MNPRRKDLIDKLLANDINLAELGELRDKITAAELSQIIQHIYDLNESYIQQLARVEGTLGFLNRMKNDARQRLFYRKISKGFRKGPKNKVILAEGDSWFNYPLILTDLIDRITMERDLALYSIAGGGDWFLNMLTGGEYVEELSVIHPDVFLISGGGNDLVGSRRLAAMVDPGGGSSEFKKNAWAKDLIDKALKHNGRQKYTPLNQAFFAEGCKYLSRDFFAVLMFFHLQYCFMIGKILGLKGKPSKFVPIQIVTQGYDYAIPSLKKGFGFNPTHWYVPIIRMFLGHGGWLKKPLLLRGVPDGNNEHYKIVYAMIYLFNEMMIELPDYLNKCKDVFHIDSRGFMKENGWTDELHPKPAKALHIGKKFIDCIQGMAPTYEQVYVVNS